MLNSAMTSIILRNIGWARSNRQGCRGILWLLYGSISLFFFSSLSTLPFLVGTLFAHVNFRLQGVTYIDAVHVLAISRAGYVPQLLCCPPNPLVIVELLRRGKAKALIYDGGYEVHLPSLPIPMFHAVDVRHVDVQSIALPSLSGDADKIAFVFHTEGVTKGVPKLVPFTFTRLDALLRRAQAMYAPINGIRQDIFTWRYGLFFLSLEFINACIL
jgi:hypothetical protein